LVSTLVLATGSLLVVWLLVAIFTASPGIDSKETVAMLACRDLAHAAEVYRDHPANSGHQIPTSVDDLIHPPWGGPSMYPKEAGEPRDPWGGSYRMEQPGMPDGTPGILVWTVKPDGMKISQFGIGRLAEP
jgi:hypothetical protein